MTITIDATFEHGMLKPVQPLDLVEGARVRLTIEDSSIPSEAFADPLADVIGIGDSGRTDGADNHDKYIYGRLRS
jgi:predicted DNA-binding antitoxin AbrB/MazE fold protein